MAAKPLDSAACLLLGFGTRAMAGTRDVANVASANSCVQLVLLEVLTTDTSWRVISVFPCVLYIADKESSTGSMLRVEERSRLTGATYMAGATFLCALTSTLNEKFAACSCLSLTLFILGDAVAALIGKSMGRIRVGEKTLEGTIACFLLCLCLGYLIFPYLPGFLEKWGGAISLTQATIVGISIALLELFPIKIKQWQLNDNLYVPVLVAYIAYLI